MTNSVIPIGTVSHGTHRSHHIAQAILGNEDCVKHLSGANRMDLTNIVLNERDDEEALEALLTIYDELSEHLPPFCYFGMHEGDGSDLGCWISDDAISDAIHDGEMVQIQDLADLDEPHLAARIQADEIIAYALMVNDHGNQSLYALERCIKTSECWSVV